MSIGLIIDKIHKEHQQIGDVIKSIESKVEQLQRELDAVPQLIGWDLLLFRIKQLLILEAGLSSDDLHELDSFWKSTTITIKHGYNFLYDPPRVYNLLLRNQESFQHLLRLYRELRKSKAPSFREDYLDAFFQLRVQYRPNLAPFELLLLRYILESQTRSPSSLVNIYGKSKSHYSKTISSLIQKKAFYEAIRFAYSALSLKVVIVLVEMDNLDADIPVQFSRNNPWIHSLFDCKFGNRFILANLILPVSWRSIDELKSWRAEILENRRVVDVRILERDEKYNWMNFDYSTFVGQGWNTTTATIGTLMRQMNRSEYSCYENTQVLSTNNLQIDDDDIRMINTLHDLGPLSIRQLRSKLSRDYNVIRSRYDELTRSGVMWYRIYPSPLFAPESITMVAKLDINTHYQLCHTLTCVPEIYAQRTKCSHSIFTMKLPEGSSDYVTSTLNDMLRGKERWMLQYTSQHFTNWQFPLDRWVSHQQVWKILESDFGG